MGTRELARALKHGAPVDSPVGRAAADHRGQARAGRRRHHLLSGRARGDVLARRSFGNESFQPSSSLPARASPTRRRHRAACATHRSAPARTPAESRRRARAGSCARTRASTWKCREDAKPITSPGCPHFLLAQRCPTCDFAVSTALGAGWAMCKRIAMNDGRSTSSRAFTKAASTPPRPRSPPPLHVPAVGGQALMWFSPSKRSPSCNRS